MIKAAIGPGLYVQQFGRAYRGAAAQADAVDTFIRWARACGYTEPQISAAYEDARAYAASVPEPVEIIDYAKNLLRDPSGVRVSNYIASALRRASLRHHV